MWLIYHLVADPWHMVCLGHWAVSTFIGRVTFAISSSTERQIFRGSLLRNFLEMMLLHDTASCKPLSPFSSGVASSNGQSFPCIICIHIYIYIYPLSTESVRLPIVLSFEGAEDGRFGV